MPPKIKVSQSTVDSLRNGKMADNLKKANSGQASAEYVEAARRFYGNRVKTTPGGASAAPATRSTPGGAKGTVNPAGVTRGTGNGKKTLPGQPGFIGPHKPRPGEKGFIGPFKPKPGQRGFIGPVDPRQNRGNAGNLALIAQRRNAMRPGVHDTIATGKKIGHALEHGASSVGSALSHMTKRKRLF